MNAHGESGSTVLVTGASGYLGGHCVRKLLERGHRVRASVRDISREHGVRAAVTPEGVPERQMSFFEADLASDQGWAEAVAGCDYVLHVASPFPDRQPKDANELIVPARDGALRVLGAAFDAGVKRVVMTSSVAAIRNGGGGPHPAPYSERDWSDPDLPGLSAYARSKTIAEREAWRFARESGTPEKLAVINPSAILGPVQGDEMSFSLQIIQRMLKGMPGVPRLGFGFVDVRDVAEMHLSAMATEAAGGERFIASGPFLWLSEVAAILRRELPEQASKAPTREVPKSVMRVIGLFDRSIGSIVGDIGKRSEYTAEKAKRILGWEARPIEETIADCGRSLATREAR